MPAEPISDTDILGLAAKCADAIADALPDTLSVTEAMAVLGYLMAVMLKGYRADFGEEGAKQWLTILQESLSE
jgi:hypothetical protein